MGTVFIILLAAGWYLPLIGYFIPSSGMVAGVGIVKLFAAGSGAIGIVPGIFDI